MSPRVWRALLSALLLSACQEPEARGRERTTDITAEDYEAPPLPRARVLLTDAFGGVHPVAVEVAATPESRTRGLMWRKALPAGQGMLFIFPQEEVQSFWMRNTLLSLDMIFIDSQRRVVGIIERAEPRTTTSRSVGVPSLYVLEVPGGWSQAVGLKRGSTVQLEGLEGIPVKP